MSACRFSDFLISWSQLYLSNRNFWENVQDNSLDIKYGEIHIKQYWIVTYLGCILDQTLSGEAMVIIKAIINKIVDSDFCIEITGYCLCLFLYWFVTL